MELSNGDAGLLFALRRKIYKELTYDERTKPMARRKLKEQKRKEQGGLCPVCHRPLPAKDTPIREQPFNRGKQEESLNQAESDEQYAMGIRFRVGIGGHGLLFCVGLPGP